MKYILGFLLLVFVATPSYAIVFGGSNLGIFGYSSHDCIKPIKPIKPYSFSSRWEVDMYNSKVDSYNFQLQVYIDCLREYVENANNDIKRIKEKTQEAIDETSN